MPLGVENIGQFFADFGVPVVSDAGTAQAILDVPGSTVEIQGVPISMTEYTLTFETAALSLRSGATIQVDGQQYQVRKVEAQDDGKISRATLKKV